MMPVVLDLVFGRLVEESRRKKVVDQLKKGCWTRKSDLARSVGLGRGKTAGSWLEAAYWSCCCGRKEKEKTRSSSKKLV
jgi:hypothetical protein